MRSSLNWRSAGPILADSAIAALIVTSQSAWATAPTPPQGPAVPAGRPDPGHLDLDPSDLAETPTNSTPQPGVTLMLSDQALVDAISVDGGGSTTMALRGQLISHPSDAAGEHSR
jgi:Phosphodiester glycosidase